MGNEKQFDSDIKRLSELIHQYTGIPKSKTVHYLRENGASRLHYNSFSLAGTEAQQQKLAALFEFMGLYENLRNNEQGIVLDTTKKAKEYFVNFYADKQDKEYFSAAFLDAGCGLIKTKVLTEGTLDETAIYPRNILRDALFVNAAAVLISHDHPAQTGRASSADIQATRAIEQALSVVDIALNDHIIVTGRKAVSFTEMGISMSNPSSNYHAYEKDTAPGKQASQKPSAREQLMSDKQKIKQEHLEPAKTGTPTKKTAGLDLG